MKYLSIFLLFFLLSCKKDDPVVVPPKIDEYPSDIYLDKDVWFPGPMTEGFIQAKKNGLDWKGTVQGSTYDFLGTTRVGIYAYTVNIKGNPREDFSISEIPFMGTKFKPYYIQYKNGIKLSDINPKYLLTTYGRLSGNNGNAMANLPLMIVDTTAITNYIEIISLDTLVTNTLELRFDVSFINSPIQVIPTLSQVKEKMRFSEGYLKVKIKR
jgi:hypothetical protein